jgi:hypothetical protein
VFLGLALSCMRAYTLYEFQKFDGYDCKGLSSIAILIVLMGLTKNAYDLIIGRLFCFWVKYENMDDIDKSILE